MITKVDDDNVDDLHLLGEHGAVPEAQATAHGVAQDDGSLPAQVVQHPPGNTRSKSDSFIKLFVTQIES